MESSLATSNFTFILYVIFMFLGVGSILWILFRQDEEKGKASQQKDKEIGELQRRLKDSEIKIKSLLGDLETVKKANEGFQLQFKELQDKSDQKDKDFQKIQEAVAAELRAKQELQKLKEDLERQLKEAKDNLAKAASESNAAKSELATAKEEADKAKEELNKSKEEINKAKAEAKKFKESCQILEKSLKQKEGVIEEELPRPLIDKEAMQKSSESKPFKETPPDSKTQDKKSSEEKPDEEKPKE